MNIRLPNASRYNRLIYPLVLSGIVFLVFFPILQQGFFIWDDSWMLYENEQVMNLDMQTISEYFSHYFHGQYSPLNTLAYAVIFQFAEFEPIWYHLFSLLLHIINTLMVYQLIRKMLPAAGPQQAEAPLPEVSNRIAFLVALFFGIHPMQVESVAWIAASKVVFYAFFALLAMLSYLHYVLHGGKKYYWLALLAFFLSFLVKEQSLILPFCLVLMDYFMGRKLLSKRVIIEKAPFFLIALVLGLIALDAQQSGFEEKLSTKYYPLHHRFVLLGFSLTEYIIKLAAPYNIDNFYEFPMQPGEKLPVRYLFYPLVVLAGGYLIIKGILRQERYLVFGAFFFLINLALALHIVPMARAVIIADRYIYMSSIGFFFPIAVVLLGQGRYSLPKMIPRYRRLATAGLAVYILLLGIKTFMYAAKWTADQ